LTWIAPSKTIHHPTRACLLGFPVLHRHITTQHFSSSISITSILAMSGSGFAIGALILVPIAIAASAAYFALKCADFFKRIGRYIRRFWDNYYPWSDINRSRRLRNKSSNLSSNPYYADSWADLESLNTLRGYDTFIGQSPRRESVKTFSEETRKSESYDDNTNEIWHPTRSTRLMWSFTNPRSPSRRRLELSNVAKPSPAARRAERLSVDDAVLLASPVRAWAHRREVTDH
jgi:hypothetical protein